MCPSSAAHEVHDLDLIAFADLGAVECRALEDDEVVFNGDAACVDVQLREQRAHCQRAGDLE